MVLVISNCVQLYQFETTPCRSGQLASPPVRDRPFERKLVLFLLLGRIRTDLLLMGYSTGRRRKAFLH